MLYAKQAEAGQGDAGAGTDEEAGDQPAQGPPPPPPSRGETPKPGQEPPPRLWTPPGSN
jgi:hypothetical protein